jgi:hypothetical protein
MGQSLESGRSRDRICDSVLKLERYIIDENYCGYDPFDTLQSPIFRWPVLRSNRFVRMGLQQVLKRFPWNVRSLIGTKKGCNPVTLGLCIQAFSYLGEVFPERREHYRHEIEQCLEKLIQLRSHGYSGTCWGYDFGWEARYASIPAFVPTIVATGIITNALFVCHHLTRNQTAIELCRDSVSFVMKDLHKTYEGPGFCYSYSPLDQQCVLNATMKAARLLAQVYSVTGQSDLLTEGRKTVQYVVNAQRDDGSWPYALGDKRKWTDNFHTGYVIDCLDDYIKTTGDSQFQPFLSKGFKFYRDNFFSNNGIPKYYDTSVYPVDSTSAAQSILTLTRFGEDNVAHNVAMYMIGEMQSTEGFFYYRKSRVRLDKTSYMRWSNAWMFAGLSYNLFSARQHDMV